MRGSLSKKTPKSIKYNSQPSIQKRIDHIRRRLPDAMCADRPGLIRGLRNLSKKTKDGRIPKDAGHRLDALEKRLERSMGKRERRFRNKPDITYPEDLPIAARRKAIVDAIRRHPVVIVSGDTGCGKSTQIPKMCLEAGRGVTGKIGCTQPRRIAAITIAGRIAEELAEDVGASVGYKIRFTDRSSPEAYIKVMTDGMLLAESQKDRFFNEYDTLIIDEAHERSLNIDLILGILKTLLRRRNDLKVVITSATIDTEKFSAAFDNAPVVRVEGRMYPVETLYWPPDAESAEMGYVESAVAAVEKIRMREPSGDLLVFMPTEQDIREACDLLAARNWSRTFILPLFARLPKGQQKRVFARSRGRKIVVATNVAETSLTIPGIKVVIDTGLARIPRYVPRTRTTSMPISPISKSSADQRKGRAGRMENGVCVRLYEEADYAARPAFTIPEILRSNLAEVILRMLSVNLGDIRAFPFVDPPREKSIQDGFDTLVELGAIKGKGKRPHLTPEGKVMARIPIDPRIARMMLEADREGCTQEVAVIASALSIQDPRERPLEKAEAADRAHRVFYDIDSDFLTYHRIWDHYHRHLEQAGTQNQMRKYCKAHFLSYIRMREWRDIHDQMLSILKDQGITCKKSRPPRAEDEGYARIHRCILSGYLSNIAMRKEGPFYTAARGKEVMLFPGSALFKKPPAWVVAAEMVKTSRLFARTAARMDPGWVEPLAGSLCKRSYIDPHWEKRRGEVRAYENVFLYGLPVVTRRPVSYGTIDPETSHDLFIRAALVDGEMPGRFGFLSHNRNLIQKLKGMEDKIRRRGVLISDEELARFYAERLPGVYDVSTLRRFIRDRGGDGFLKMTQDDLIVDRPDVRVLAAFPDKMALRDQRLNVSYRFSPGAEDDGVTLNLPAAMASSIPTNRLEWLVPGLFEEKVTALIKGLPKQYRKQLVPATDTAAVVAKEMPRTDDPLATALSRFIHRRFGVDIPAAEWPADTLPDHLKMRVSLRDHRGKEVGSGRDIHRLKSADGWVSEDPSGSAAWRKAREMWEKSDVRSWDFGEMPEAIEVERDVKAYPALAPEENRVRLRLYQDPVKAAEIHLQGVERLLSLKMAKELRGLRTLCKIPEDALAACGYFGGLTAVQGYVLESVTRRLFRRDVRSGEAFTALQTEIRPKLSAAIKELGDRVVEVIRAYHETRTFLHTMEKASNSRAALGLCQKIREELAHLVPIDFPKRYDEDRLGHLPRYLRAMALRAERGINDPTKEEKKGAELMEFQDALKSLQKNLAPESTLKKKAAVADFRWMVEEFKVSLFAQELKTPYPVSKKRLRRRVQEIQRMI
jgi:ATP-dependent helicase HrpA